MQLQNETIKERTPIKGLLIDWLIIFGTYLFIRVFFALFGLHQNIVLLAVALRYCHIFWGQYIYRNPTSNVHYGFLHWLF